MRNGRLRKERGPRRFFRFIRETIGGNTDENARSTDNSVARLTGTRVFRPRKVREIFGITSDRALLERRLSRVPSEVREKIKRRGRDKEEVEVVKEEEEEEEGALVITPL